MSLTGLVGSDFPGPVLVGSGATEPGPASKRYGVELANYYSPKPWLIFDGDFSWSQARFTEFNPGGQYVPEAVDVVVSGGASLDNFHRTFASLRLRYFGPRALIEDNSVRSKATTLLNFEGGYQLAKALRLNAQVYNLLDAEVSDIDYYFASRLPGEPLAGVCVLLLNFNGFDPVAQSVTTGADGAAVFTGIPAGILVNPIPGTTGEVTIGQRLPGTYDRTSCFFAEGEGGKPLWIDSFPLVLVQAGEEQSRDFLVSRCAATSPDGKFCTEKME